MEKRILVIFPHPDDEAFSSSGTLSMRIEEGYEVTYACLTLGEMGRNMGLPPIATRESLPSIRKKELEEACRAIGIQNLRLLGIRDKTVEFEDEEKLAERFLGIITELQPELVITFYPGYSVHPDHDATGRAVVRAMKKIDPSTRPTLHCVAFSKNCEKEIGLPNVVIDVEKVWDKKLATMQAHHSQTSWMAKSLEKNQQINQRLDFFRKERFWVYKF